MLIEKLPMPEVFFHSTVPAAVLRIGGDDAASFLQGQFSNDLSQQRTNSVSYGLWLTVKGKVQGDSYVLGLSDGSWLVTSVGTSAETLRKRFDSYIIADDVSVDPVEAYTLIVAFSENGKEGEDGVLSAETQRPDPGAYAKLADGYLFRGAVAGWCWIGPDVSARALRSRLELEGLRPVDRDHFERWRVTSLIPAIPQDVTAGDLPQEAAMERYAVSFTKGCYLGQEVMARLQSMGQVRRILTLVSGSGEPPASGSEVFAQGKRVGELRSVARSGKGVGGFLALAMVQRSAVASGGQLEVIVSEGSRPLAIVPRPLE